MIPLILRIQNFLSYGSSIQTIDFRPYKLICLSGKNGHGKSALLDAITWALWGFARKTTGTSKADQGVLKLGQTDMMVSLDFIANGATYRVRRVFSTKYGKPSAHLDFGTYNSITDTFIPLTEKTIRKTQDILIETLGIDYDAFINSSFIRQGQSNEFSKKSPKDRKDVLASILGLNRYDKARKLALEESKKCMQAAEHNQKMIQHIQAICDTLPSYQTKLNTVQTQLQEQTIQYESIQRSISQLQKEQERITLSLHELALQEQHASKPPTETMLHVKSDLLSVQNDIQILSSDIQKAFQTNIQTLNITLEGTKKECALLEEMHIKGTKEIAKLEADYQVQTVTIQQLQEKTPALLLVNDTQELQLKFDRYKNYYQKWINAGNIVSNEIKHLYDKKKLLEDTSNPSCPLCEQNVSQARKRFLAGKLSSADRFLLYKFEKLKRLITWIKASITDMHTALEASKKIDALLQEQAKLHAQLYTKKDEMNDLSQRIKTTKQHIDEQQKQLQTLQQEIATQFDTHTVYQQLVAKKTTLTTTLEQLEKEHAIMQKQHLDTYAKQNKALRSELLAIQEQEKKCLEQHVQSEKQKSLFLQEKGALEQAIQTIELQQKELTTYKQEYETLQNTAHDYADIATAYGKDGLQALLIEDALPEIEQEANDLLSRLTDNQTHIFIESLRDLKKGGTKETLDINISDSYGIRPYEMFSGGEAFRIDFALRIAISKLLARRAGTSLQTLIIDEGFGSQDEDGLSKIMDVIYKIQDDFEKVIIVSHLTTMKDQFPVHFIIEKEHTGSKIHIKELA